MKKMSLEILKRYKRERKRRILIIWEIDFVEETKKKERERDRRILGRDSFGV